MVVAKTVELVNRLLPVGAAHVRDKRKAARHLRGTVFGEIEARYGTKRAQQLLEIVFARVFAQIGDAHRVAVIASTAAAATARPYTHTHTT